MDHSKIALLKNMYAEVKNSQQYHEKFNKLKVIPCFKKIIWQTLQHEQLTNEYLTGLIHLFKYNCSSTNFDKYLEINISDPLVRKELSDEAYEIDENGFTNAGKRSIQTLDKNQLEVIKQFLISAFSIKTVQDGIEICKQYIRKNIPIVTEGIYSPWLFYINPGIFPLINDGIKGFKSWMKLSKNYDENVLEFKIIKEAIGEENLGLIDALTTSVMADGKLNIKRTLYLKNHKFFKISHRIFIKQEKFIKSGFAQILEQNNWICMSKYTGKGGGENFEKGVAIGDFVYLCYGGDKLIYVAKVVSDCKFLNDEHAKLIGDEDEEWIYREIEPLFFPTDPYLSDLKMHKEYAMPSSRITFWEVTPDKLETMNDLMFLPKFNLEILGSDDREPEDSLDNNSTPQNNSMPLNSILYGPPGTGKTYNSIFQAVAIIEGKEVKVIEAEEFKNVKPRFDRYVNEGRIVFTTFHQSLGYEDFIEGIKPIPPKNEGDAINYQVEDGMFKKLCTNAAFQIANSLPSEIKTAIISFENSYDELVADINEKLLSGEKYELQTRSGGTILVDRVTDLGNVLVRHNPQTQTYTVSKRRLAKLDTAFASLDDVTNIDKGFRAVIGGANASAYWAVLHAMRNMNPSVSEAPTGNYDYDAKKELVGKLPSTDFNKGLQQPYVIIIDEINRGNIAQIFGELITLLEDDKRLGKETALTVTLPYSKERFGVPPNVFVIGTMNTADRSVEALDTALRRRFAFIPKMPEPERLEPADGINLPAILTTLNKRLTILKDSDHTIGHAWLLGVKSFQQLQTAFGDKILPLLQEYFYNDYEKLGLVLGDAFFTINAPVNSSDVFASFNSSTNLAGQYDQSRQYQLKQATELSIADFKTLEHLKPPPASNA